MRSRRFPRYSPPFTHTGIPIVVERFGGLAVALAALEQFRIGRTVRVGIVTIRDIWRNRVSAGRSRKWGTYRRIGGSGIYQGVAPPRSNAPVHLPIARTRSLP